MVRVIEDPDNQQAKFAVLVRSDMKGNTLGYQLMNKIIRYRRSQGTRRLTAITMPENKKMLQLAQKLSFSFDI
ncbi:hypothetical protein ARSQ2_00003 [Arsenophonus endosymbiont of Bemisia tabaci Q2]|nr:hypothetical protein ARSQ2_00003 [Arsenophonus endosymbiont of Bemisia tabaci Q2]